MLHNTEIHFNFIEADKQNVDSLKSELAGYSLPKNVFADVHTGDCFQIIETAVSEMEKDGKQMAPAFIFVDPYGFKLPGVLLKKLLSYPKTELFVNVIWRELNMAIQLGQGIGNQQTTDSGKSLFEDIEDPEQETQAAKKREKSRESHETTLNSIFVDDKWRSIQAEGADRRAEQCAELFRQMTCAK